MDWEAALEQCDTILELIENEVPERAWDQGADFFEGIRERAKEMSDWIEEHEHVTPKMAKALDGMERGVRKWIRD